MGGPRHVVASIRFDSITAARTEGPAPNWRGGHFRDLHLQVLEARAERVRRHPRRRHASDRQQL